MSNHSDRIKKYGVCINNKCENYKLVVEIQYGDMECKVCRKKLLPYAPPKKKSKKKLILFAIVAALAIAVTIGIFLLFTESKSGVSPTTSTVVEPVVDTTAIKPAATLAKTDTVVVRDTVVKRDTVVQKAVVSVPAKPATRVVASESSSAPSRQTVGSKNLGYATFKGTWPNDVNGRMVFHSSHVIDSRDPKGRMAEPGDYVIGEWSDGHLVQGIWYGADNQVKGSVIIGK